MIKRYSVTVEFKTKDPSPPEMEEFYDSLTSTLREDKWFYQEYAVAGKNKGVRRIGFEDLTTLQVSTLKAKAKEHLPKAKVVKRTET